MKFLVDACFNTPLMAERAIYTDRDFLETECRVQPTTDTSQWGDAFTITSEQVVLRVNRSEIPDRPRRGETFTLETGRTYMVDQVMQADQYEFWVLAVEQQ